MKNRYSTIDQYLATVPDATEAISYQIPTFKLNGNRIHFAACTKHIGIYPVPERTRAFNRELAPYVTGRGTIQFALDRPVPYPLLKKIVRARRAAQAVHVPPMLLHGNGLLARWLITDWQTPEAACRTARARHCCSLY